MFRLGRSALLTLSALFSCSLAAFSAAPASAQQRLPVLVAGGTPAGVAAAIAAARGGSDVVLVARRTRLGGVLTDAMMDQWDLNTAPGGASIEGGLFGEIHARLGDVFTPQEAARTFDAMVAAEPRIRVITGARAFAATRDAGGTVSSVQFRGGDGRTFAVASDAIVDATDDGDVAALAGARYDLGRQDTGIDERMQAVTLMFTLHGVDWHALAAGYDHTRDGRGGAAGPRAWGFARVLAGYRPLSPDVLVRDANFGREPGGEVTVNAIDVVGIDGLSDADLARARAICERETPHLLAYLRVTVPGFAQATLGRFADAVYVRETRHFAGRERVTAGDIWDGRIPSDAIGLSSYPLDLHPLTAGDRLAYAPVRHVYGVPFGAMVPRDLTDVLLASPAISATHIASGSVRVIPTTIEEGEAAGIAAALAQREHLTFAAMADNPDAIADVRDALRADGAILTYAAARGRVRTGG